MNTRTFLLAALVFAAHLGSTNALTIFGEITSPDHLPDNLKVEVRNHADEPEVLRVKVTFTITEPELYKGRVMARGHLTVIREGKLITSATLNGGREGTTYTYHFDLARDAFPDSILTLSTSLYEKDGMATIGGGEIIDIHLKEFATNEP